MAIGTLFYLPIALAETTNNDPAAGAKLFFYLAGTMTPAAVYTDVALTVPHTQPVVANAAGRFPEIFLTPGVSYKVDMQTAGNVPISGYPADNVSAMPSASGNTDVSGLAGEVIAIGNVCYLSDGTGGKTAGSWFLADNSAAHSCTTPQLSMATTNIASGSTGAFRLIGRATDLAGFVAGQLYYVGTAGALVTTTTQQFVRFVGQADSPSSIVVSPDPPASGSGGLDIVQIWALI